MISFLAFVVTFIVCRLISHWLRQSNRLSYLKLVRMYRRLFGERSFYRVEPEATDRLFVKNAGPELLKRIEEMGFVEETFW